MTSRDMLLLIVEHGDEQAAATAADQLGQNISLAVRKAPMSSEWVLAQMTESKAKARFAAAHCGDRATLETIAGNERWLKIAREEIRQHPLCTEELRSRITPTPERAHWRNVLATGVGAKLDEFIAEPSKLQGVTLDSLLLLLSNLREDEGDVGGYIEKLVEALAGSLTIRLLEKVLEYRYYNPEVRGAELYAQCSSATTTLLTYGDKDKEGHPCAMDFLQRVSHQHGEVLRKVESEVLALVIDEDSFFVTTGLTKKADEWLSQEAQNLAKSSAGWSELFSLDELSEDEIVNVFAAHRRDGTLGRLVNFVRDDEDVEQARRVLDALGVATISDDLSEAAVTPFVRACWRSHDSAVIDQLLARSSDALVLKMLCGTMLRRGTGVDAEYVVSRLADEMELRSLQVNSNAFSFGGVRGEEWDIALVQHVRGAAGWVVSDPVLRSGVLGQHVYDTLRGAENRDMAFDLFTNQRDISLAQLMTTLSRVGASAR